MFWFIYSLQAQIILVCTNRCSITCDHYILLLLFFFTLYFFSVSCPVLSQIFCFSQRFLWMDHSFLTSIACKSSSSLLGFYLSVCVCGVTGAKQWCHVSNYTELRPIDHVTSRSQICLLQASNCLDRIHHIQIPYQPLCVYARALTHAIKCIVHLKRSV